jgi:hypothetical protein
VENNASGSCQYCTFTPSTFTIVSFIGSRSDGSTAASTSSSMLQVKTEKPSHTVAT